jgi:hypothetical protein
VEGARSVRGLLGCWVVDGEMGSMCDP